MHLTDGSFLQGLTLFCCEPQMSAMPDRSYLNWISNLSFWINQYFCKGNWTVSRKYQTNTKSYM